MIDDDELRETDLPWSELTVLLQGPLLGCDLTAHVDDNRARRAPDLGMIIEK